MELRKDWVVDLISTDRDIIPCHWRLKLLVEGKWMKNEVCIWHLYSKMLKKCWTNFVRKVASFCKLNLMRAARRLLGKWTTHFKARISKNKRRITPIKDRKTFKGWCELLGNLRFMVRSMSDCLWYKSCDRWEVRSPRGSPLITVEEKMGCWFVFEWYGHHS